MPIPKKRPSKPVKRGPGDVHGVTRPPIRADDPSWPHLAQMLGEIVAELHRIAEAIIDSRPQLNPAAGYQTGREYVSGGFHRRSGDIYQSVAEPGSPNAGEYDYKIRETDAGRWEVYDVDGKLLDSFPDPVSAGQWARERIIAKAKHDDNPSRSV